MLLDSIVKINSLMPNYFDLDLGSLKNHEDIGQRIYQYRFMADNGDYQLVGCIKTMLFTILMNTGWKIWGVGYSHIFTYLYIYPYSQKFSNVLQRYGLDFCPLNVIQLDIL